MPYRLSQYEIRDEHQRSSRGSRRERIPPVRFDLESEEKNRSFIEERAERGSREIPSTREPLGALDDDYAFSTGTGLPRRSQFGDRYQGRNIGDRFGSPKLTPVDPLESDNSGPVPPIHPDAYANSEDEPNNTYRRRRSRSFSPVRSRSGSDDDESVVRIRRRRPLRSRAQLKNTRFYATGSDTQCSSGSDSDSGISDDAYSFTLSRHHRTNLNPDSASDAVSDVSEGDTPQLDLEKPSTTSLLVPKTHNIFGSRYTGEGSIGGVQTAQLTVLPTPPQGQGTKKSRPPLFRWIHFEDPAMNFDDYQNSISAIAGLTDLERQAISRLLARARKRFDKPFQTSTGIKAKFLMPSLIAENITSQTRSKTAKPRVVTWMCLPHFRLQKYKAGTSAASARPADHPMRTLMQARFSLVQKERDMQQAVCHLRDTPDDYCFHIAQTWYLVLDDSLLVTCAGIRMSSLEGDAIKILPEPSLKHHGAWPPCIVVACGRCLLWSFRVDECQSWFDFVSHFGEFWPRKLEFKHNGKIVAASDWPRMINLARRVTVRLSLDHRAPSKDKFEAPDSFMLAQYDLKAVPDLKDQTEPNQQQKGTEAPLKVPEFVIREFGSERSRDPRLEKPTDTPENSDTLKPKSGTPSKTLDTPKPVETRGISPKPVNLSDGFYVFTWLNAHPATMLSPPPMASPPERSHSRNRSASSANGLSHDETPNPKAGPEIQWNVDEQGVKSDLKEVDDFLASRSSLSDRVMYQECAVSSRQVVFDALAKAKKKIMDATEKKDQDRLEVLENKTTILAASDLLFQFFLPSGFEGPTVDKFWGALNTLLFPDKSNKADKPERPSQYNHSRPKERQYKRKRNFGISDREIPGIIEFLGVTVKQTLPFKELYSQARSTDRLNIQLPEEFPKAWLYLLICFASSTKDMMVYETQSFVVQDLLDKGMRKVVQGTAKKSLLESLVFTPFELATLINFQLLEGATAYSQDIIEPYWQYLRGLEADIAAHPLDRGHQDRIALLQQEIYVITDTLSQQRRMLLLASPSASSKTTQPYGRANPLGKPYDEDFYRSKPVDMYGNYPVSRVPPVYVHERSPAHMRYSTHNIDPDDVPIVVTNPALSPTSQLAPTHPNGVLGILMHDSLSLVDYKLRDLKEMTDWVTHLSSSSLQKIDTNKDRQEAAIYAFTIVTIVFLPLSTVAGILGMNTVDVRDMELTQWVFWAAAVPLCVVIITLCLIWAGELGNFWKGFRDVWRNGRRRGVGKAAGRFGSMRRYTIDSHEQVMRMPPPPPLPPGGIPHGGMYEPRARSRVMNSARMYM